MAQRNTQRYRSSEQMEDIDWNERNREEEDDRTSEDYRGSLYDRDRSRSYASTDINRAGGGRGYARGDYGQAGRNRESSQDQGEWAGRGYARGDYGQASRNRENWEDQGDWTGHGYARGDYGQDYGRNRAERSRRYETGAGRGYGYGDYGQGNRSYEDEWGESSGRMMSGEREGYERRQGSTISSPVTWSYTEWWLVPGPYSGRGPQGWQRPKERIMEDVCERLTQHGQLDASNVKVDVDNGEVTLTGTVNNRRAKRQAEDIAESVPGVTDVHNQLRVQGENKESGEMHNDPTTSTR